MVVLVSREAAKAKKNPLKAGTKVVIEGELTLLETTPYGEDQSGRNHCD